MVDEFTIKPLEKVAVIGDSGSGKSTLLDMMALVLRPDEAETMIFKPSPSEKARDLEADWRLERLSALERVRRSHLGYVMQTGGLLPFLTVKDNILLPAELKGNQKRSERKEKFQFLTEELKIDHLLNKYPSRISMGERQRCAIARALIHKPAMVLADEPTASLDPPTADLVFELMLELCRDSALIVSTHDRERVRNSFFRVVRIVCDRPVPGRPIRARLELDDGREFEESRSQLDLSDIGIRPKFPNDVDRSSETRGSSRRGASRGRS
jgi:putative ABC transport system ATP-binding protein